MSFAFEIELPDELLDELAQKVLRRLGEAPERRFLSKPALADYLGVPQRTVKTWRERGLPGRKIGRVVMFDVAEVERWIEGEG